MLMPPKFGRLSIGIRTLRRGDSGSDVLRLQERLQARGYDVGELDGEFGYVTEDALISFQRDYRLRADGVLGPKTAFALEAVLPPQRQFHVVQWGERLSDIADRYGISVSALRWMNGLRAPAGVRQGRRLLVWRSYVVIAPHPQANPSVVERDLRSRTHLVSAVATPPFACQSDGTLSDFEGDEYVEMARRFGWDVYLNVKGGDRPLGDIVIRRRSRQRLAKELAALSDQARGRAVLIDVGPIPLGAGPRIERLCDEVKRLLPKATLALTLPPLDQGWRAMATGLEPTKLGRKADRILIALHRWEHLVRPNGEPLSFERLERWIAQAVREIPPWKVWMGIPTGGCRIRQQGRSAIIEEVSYRQAVSEGFGMGVRPRRETEGFSRMAGDESQPTYLLQGRDALERFMRIALRYRLAGVYLDPIGNEDRRLWDVLAHRLATLRPQLASISPAKES